MHGAGHSGIDRGSELGRGRSPRDSGHGVLHGVYRQATTLLDTLGQSLGNGTSAVQRPSVARERALLGGAEGQEVTCGREDIPDSVGHSADLRLDTLDEPVNDRGSGMPEHATQITQGSEDLTRDPAYEVNRSVEAIRDGVLGSVNCTRDGPGDSRPGRRDLSKESREYARDGANDASDRVVDRAHSGSDHGRYNPEHLDDGLKCRELERDKRCRDLRYQRDDRSQHVDNR